MIPSAQPFANPTSAPVTAMYQSNEVLFWLGLNDGSIQVSKTQASDENDVLGTSYILFGRNSKHQNPFPSVISLGDDSSREFVSEISKSEGVGIRHDTVIRSTTVIGDVNGDTFLDLMVGYPLASKCSIYLGNGVDDFTTIVATTGESFAIIGDPYDGGGFLGWSSIRIGDLNSDGCDEMVVSAIFANTVYVIYGRHGITRRSIPVNVLLAPDGFKIIGNPVEINFGISLTLLHDFQSDGHADIAITAQKASNGQSIIYVLFGATLFKKRESVEMEPIMNNSRACFKIITPVLSFAGFSVAGIGDINSDGYDDLAIGSVPYRRGSFVTQHTYVIYGRKIGTDEENELELSNMRITDGFVITGGGFLVAGIGDVNYDSINDMMFTSYYDWKGQSCAYLVTGPRNMSYSPSQQPSSFPTAQLVTSSPSSSLNTTNKISFVSSGNFSTDPPNPTRRPSRIPSLRPSLRPHQEEFPLLPSSSILAVGTAHPSAGKPSPLPTLSPTTGYHHLRGFSPTPLPTLSPTISIFSGYIDVVCNRPGDYSAKNASNYKFIITASKGSVNIVGNGDGGAKNIYVLTCPSQLTNVIIKNFRLSTDILSVAHLTDFSFHSLSDISHSSRGGPLTLPFCSRNRLQVILSSHTSFDLQDSNFLFTRTGSDTAKKSVNDSVLAQVQVGIVFGVFLIFFVILKVTKAAEDREESSNKSTSRFDQFEKHAEESISSSASSFYPAARPESAQSHYHSPDSLDTLSFSESSEIADLLNTGSELSSSASSLHSSLYVFSSNSKEDENKNDNPLSNSFADDRVERSCSSLHSSMYNISGNDVVNQQNDADDRESQTSDSSGSRTLQLLFTGYDVQGEIERNSNLISPNNNKRE
jgi:hypothetical protein